MTVDAMSAAVALNRGSTIASISFQPPLIPLLDTNHCSAWEQELKKHATKWEVRKATVDLWNQLPARAGLYMFVWRPPLHFQMEKRAESHAFCWVLYVGHAGGSGSRNTLRVRYKSEYSKYLAGDPGLLFVNPTGGGRQELLRRWLLLQPLEYWWAEVKDTARLIAIEKEMIKLLGPPLNTQHRMLRTRESTRGPAF